MDRNITHIIVHHSVTPRDLSMNKSLKSFNENHKWRLAGQPDSGTKWKHISYHRVIDAKGNVEVTRSDDVLGWHASNYRVNEKSIAICLIGNFDIETPTNEQIKVLRGLVVALKMQYPTIRFVQGHRKYAGKSCPGFNINEGLLYDLQKYVQEPVITVWAGSISSRIKRAQRGLRRATGATKKRLQRILKRLLKTK